VLDRLFQGVREGKEWLTRFLFSLSPQQKKLLFRGVPVLLVTLGVGGYFLQRDRYRPLFTNLASQDAAAVVRELDAQKIPYQIRRDGSVIEVPEQVLYHTRLGLAGKGLPMGGGIGFEIFEQAPFGASEFTQRVNYLRALQGELSRTINALEAVQSSRVHLAIPPRSAFFGREEKPSASMVVDLRPGYYLTPEQVQGIINLVSSSVEGLVPEKVTLVDSSGRPLRPKGEETETETESLHRLKVRLEREMEERIETMLEPALGSGKAVVRVSVELEFRQTQLTQEEFDPSTQVVRSQQQEMEKPDAQPGGVPGTQANIPGGDAEKPKEQSSTKESRLINYEMGRTTSQVVEPRGQIRRLSVAVLVDGRYEGDVYSPRSPEEMEVLKAIVAKAAGFNGERGDQVEVANIPFKVETPPQAQETALPDLRQWASSPQGIGVGAALLLLLVLLGVGLRRRRVRQTLSEEQPAIEQAREQTRQEVEESLSGAVQKITVTGDPRREQLAQVARDYPEVTLQIIRMWLKEGRKMKIEAQEGQETGQG
jgi:flagellar M-ring protein FliF